MRILIILTRNPYSRGTGRKAVLKTIVRSLLKLGHQLELVIYDTDISPCTDNVRVFFRDPGRIFALFRRTFRYAFMGRLSLNEAVYCSGAELRFIRRISRQNHYDLVVADMIRTAPLAATADCPIILDLDDLLSVRYDNFLKNGAAGFLGYFEERLPKFLRALVDKLGPVILRREAERLAAREEYWAGKADAVSLVSPLEAEQLSKRTGSKIFTLPMAVDIPEDVWRSDVKFQRSAVFVGALNYRPNVDAIRWYLRNVSGMCDVRLDVIGACPEEVRSKYGSSHINFAGYAEDLYAELRVSRIFVAPIVSGTGIKTKVLEALAAGIPLVATSEAVRGLGVKDGEHCLIADTGKDFAAAMDSAMSNLSQSLERAARGRELVARNFSSEAVTGKWKEVLEHVIS